MTKQTTYRVDIDSFGKIAIFDKSGDLWISPVSFTYAMFKDLPRGSEELDANPTERELFKRGFNGEKMPLMMGQRVKAYFGSQESEELLRSCAKAYDAGKKSFKDLEGRVGQTITV